MIAIGRLRLMDLDGSAYPIAFLYIPYEKGFLLVPFGARFRAHRKSGGW